MVFVVVRVDTNEGLDTLLSQLNRFELPYNVCSEDNLEAPVSTSTSSSTSVTDTADSCDVVGATVTAEVVVSGEEIDIATLLGSRSDGDDGTLEPTNGAWPDACTSEGLTVQSDDAWTLATTSLSVPSYRRRVPNNIKRYRRQMCKICGSFNLVPFLRSKMLHAAIHSDFKRYKCPYCDKRGVSVATITLHIKSRHPGKPRNKYYDEMNEEEYMKLLLLTEKCFDNPYM